MRHIWLSAVLFLVGCAGSPPRHVVDTVEVNVPILERAEAPKELFRTKISADQIPLWVAPADPAATVCVTKAGETMLKRIILRDQSLLDGWEKYGAH